MNHIELEQIINEKLAVQDFQDYAPNGLQVEGREQVQRVVTGVTACQALLDEAVRLNADAVLVHHGYFWKNEPVSIRGMKQRRIKTLLCNDMNLYGYHLPLDAHPELGNNAKLAQLMGSRSPGRLIRCFRAVSSRNRSAARNWCSVYSKGWIGRFCIAGITRLLRLKNWAGVPAAVRVLFRQPQMRGLTAL